MLDLGITAFGNDLVAAWKGIPGDDSLWYSSFDGSSWAPQAQIQGVGSSVGPSLTVFNGRLYAAWRGTDAGNSLWYSSFDGSSWAPQAQIQGVGSSAGPSLTVFNGRLYAAWRGTDAGNSLWYSSFDGSSWAPQAQIQGVGSSIGPSLAGFGGRLYAAWRGSGTDERLWYSSFDGSSWAPQAQIPGQSTIGPSLRVGFGGRLYAAWRGSGTDERLWYSSFDGSSWAPQAQIPGQSTIGPSLTVFNDRLYAAWRGSGTDERLWYSSFDGSSWAPQAQIPGVSSGPDLVPAPAAGLGSNSNYILYSGCSPLVDLTVTITVTEDMVWKSSAPPPGSNSTPSDGFGFQLNAYSPAGELCAYQQYVIALIGTELIGGVDNWPVDGTNLINDFFNLASLPSVAIPAGYVLQISLANDNNGNVVSVTYVVTDNLGNTQANVPVTLLSVGGATSADLAPITAFELDLVGPINGDSSVLSSGAGTITYEAADNLVVLNKEPSCTETGSVTEEATNSFYGQLPANPSNTIITQSFEISTAQPMIRKQGKPRPGLIIPRA